MTDIHSPEQRSKNMSRIRGKDTKPERLVRSLLFKEGYRFRKNDSRLPGKPDIVLPKYKMVVFVHGCFWHGHGCRFSVTPKTNTAFWVEKIAKNQERDLKNIARLKEIGWDVHLIWECQIESSFKELMEKLKNLKQLNK